MIKAAVLGSPIEHSLSPLIHNQAYEILGIEGQYSKIEMNGEDFIPFIQSESENGWTGFSLTMPLKESAFSIGFECEDRARRIHSVNTLIHQNGTFFGYSTDVRAFDRLIDGLTFSSVAVIGGGGTARAALGALDGVVERIDVIQRSSHRNDLLTQALISSGINFKDMGASLENYDLVISTTPAGVSDFFISSLGENPGTLIEVLYKPLPTKLSAAWKERGGFVVDGLDLLVEQALDQIHLMTSLNFDFASMRALLIANLRSL